jgi:hypothetical protein
VLSVSLPQRSTRYPNAPGLSDLGLPRTISIVLARKTVSCNRRRRYSPQGVRHDPPGQQNGLKSPAVPR